MSTAADGQTGLVAGKRALVVGVANKRSIAWSIAQALDGAGASVALTFQNERTERDVRKLAETLTNATPVFELDVQDDDMVRRSIDAAAAAMGGIDVLVHAVAFARPEDLTGRFTAITREGFHLAMDVSAYSLLALAKAVEPHMRDGGGGSIMSLSYIAAERAVPGYNVMGIAKSALESITRYLAHDLGDAGIRVNAISAGPIRTLAARGIPGFSEMADTIAARTPLRREITVDEVGATGLYLASDLSAAVTGETLHVDAGYHAMGM
ncbi:MAG: enoyl-ACP reductase [Actinobacteria bacterium]|nr:enoyl-ACP reductase [Thermoleophilia bacterium]MCB9010284.1 enoyl-ACP reductase [Actinomycetota bacterium]MCB9010499.1 enoyl-ACP reductase [Actinomycetota bacterium]